MGRTQVDQNDKKQLAQQMLQDGVNQKDVATYFGVTRQTIKSWVDKEYRQRQNTRQTSWHKQNRHLITRSTASIEKRREYSRNYPTRTKHGPITYFIQDGEFVKIGTTDNLPRRLNHLQCGNPRQLEVLGITDRSERELHKEFEALRVAPNSEWFYFTPAMEVFIQENSKPLVIKGLSSADPQEKFAP